MSWDAYLYDDRGHLDGEWGYTHNCNGMANTALRESGYDVPWDETSCQRFRDGRWFTEPYGHQSWWKVLNGMDGPRGAELLGRIIRGLEADPERFIAMNPPNGWGDYDSFLLVLRDMHKSVPEWPTVWSTSG